MDTGNPSASSAALLTSFAEPEEARAQLQLTLDCADMGAWTYDSASGVFRADARVQAIFGADKAEGDLEYWLRFVHEADRTRVVEHFQQALTGAQRYDLEYRLAAEGRWVRSKGQISGSLTRSMVAVVEDITERKKLEEQLRTSEEGMRLAQEAAGIASWDWNALTGEFSWHPRGTRVYGRPSDELCDLDAIFSFIEEEDRAKARAAVDAALEGREEFKADYRVSWPDGSTHWLVAQGKPIHSDGAVTRIVGITMDVTEPRKIEIALRQSEKLAAVGRLASSIAHEINNPLESVTNLLYLVRSSDKLEDIQEYAETAERELRRVSLIANQTLKFRKQATNPAPFYCYDLIGESLAMFQGRLVNRRVTVEKRKRATEAVECRGDEIKQVLGNLIGNAIDSMPFGGRLLLRSREARDWKTGRRGVVLTVADTGTGMSAATKKMIFEAFFTTKGIGGTGLGLWLSCEIIKRHHGNLRVRSCEREGHSGSVFTLFLPFV